MNDVWVEKWRPKKLDDVVGQQHIKNDLKGMLEKKNIPHLLFSGRAGIGKTTTAHIIANELLGKTKNVNFIEMNASDERKIDDVRNKIKTFAMSSPMESDFKIILLDEAENITPDGQMALRRIMEKYAATCRFILCCNNKEKVIEPIYSRCAAFEFHPIEVNDIVYRLEQICKEEALTFDKEALSIIADKAKGDIRGAIQKLQSVASSGNVTKQSVLSDKLDSTFLWAVKCLVIEWNFNASREAIWKFIREGGSDVVFLVKLHERIMDLDIEYDKKAKYTRIISDAHRDLLFGLTNSIVIDNMIFRFGEVK